MRLTGGYTTPLGRLALLPQNSTGQFVLPLALVCDPRSHGFVLARSENSNVTNRLSIFSVRKDLLIHELSVEGRVCAI